jgi:hypothetical protein
MNENYVVKRAAPQLFDGSLALCLHSFIILIRNVEGLR